MRTNNLNKIAEKNTKWLLFLIVGAIATICIIKFWFCSVSIGGDVFYCMTADYWNFGKGILNGQTLYVDLLDHKGVYLFWIYALFSLLSGGNIGIVAIIETFLFAFTIFSFSTFVMNRTNNQIKTAIWGLLFSIFYFFITFNVTILNVEGILCPFYFWMYHVAVHKENPSKKDFFVIGLLLGFFTTIKYSSILYFAYLFVFATASYFIRKKDANQYKKLVGSGTIGVLIFVIPFVIYLFATGTFSAYMELMTHSSDISLTKMWMCFALSIVFLVYAIVLFYKKKDFYETWLCISIFTLSFIGALLINHYTCLLFSMLLPCFFEKWKFEKKDLVMVSIVFVYFGLIFQSKVDLQYSSVYIANKYGINNSNVLYFTEDLGYGANSKELFVEPYQWLPARMLINDEFYQEMYQLSKERIEDKRFLYIVGYEYDEYDGLSESYNLWEELLPFVQENYTKIEEDVLLDGESLWIANQ